MRKGHISAIVIGIIVLLVASTFIGAYSGFNFTSTEEPTTAPSTSTNGQIYFESGYGELQVIFLDVDQADCILLKTDNHAMLIDAGNTGQDKLILDYLKEYGITELDYLVATHPHADHIGSMTSVVKEMNRIGEVIMPDRPHTTKTYENLLKAINEKNIPINTVSVGEVFDMGKANIQVIAPKDTGDADLNEVSVVLRVTFGDTVFLFTGDAGTKSEKAQLESGLSLKADVLKVGHHGSRTSSTQKYLDAVAPSYVVISCGTDNSYGHPHKEAMTRLSGTGSTIYRTDESGTIIFVSDGKTISIIVTQESTTPPTPTSSAPVTEPVVYIGNKNSKTFHLSTCSSLPAEQNRVYFDSRQEALDAGYTPCGVCKP
jgi:beta-lactamase superfamily II metal-dependent hydrolase